MTKPTLMIGVVADYRVIDPHGFHMAGDKYLRAVTQAMGALPVIVPAMAGEIDAHAVVSRLDGLMLTGSYSNIEPHHYGEENIESNPLRDPQRDTAAFALIHASIEQGLPVLGVCRGFQELNVALGGSLHQQVHEVPGLMDHRERKTDDLEKQYAPAHPVKLAQGGYLHRCAGEGEVLVNSLHTQGVNRLAPGFAVEAESADGLIEAYRLESEQQFLLAVQWHPEWKVMENAFYRSIFELFKQACEKYRLHGGHRK